MTASQPPPPAPEWNGPLIANVTTLLGFVVLFTVFATGHAMSVVVGAVMIVAGGLWAGYAGEDG